MPELRDSIQAAFEPPAPFQFHDSPLTDSILNPTGALMRQRAETNAPWQQVAGELAASTPNIDLGAAKKQYEPVRMSIAAKREAEGGVKDSPSDAGFYTRRVLPFFSTVFGAGKTIKLGKAQKRVEAGTATEADFREIAYAERMQEIDKQRSTAEKLFSDAVGIPAFIGEMLAGGAIAKPVLGAVGLGAKRAATEAAIPLLSSEGLKQLGKGLAATSIKTVPIPSLYLGRAAQNLVESKGDITNPVDVAKAATPAFLLGVAQMSIVGQLGKYGNAVPTLAGRLGTKTAIGMTEQQGLDLGASAVDDLAKSVTGYGLGLSTRYGLAGEFFRKDGEPLRHSLSQAMQFGVFAAMHGRSGIKPLDAWKESLESFGKSGTPRAEAAKELERVSDVATEAAADGVPFTPSMVKDIKPSAIVYAKALAEESKAASERKIQPGEIEPIDTAVVPPEPKESPASPASGEKLPENAQAPPAKVDEVRQPAEKPPESPLPSDRSKLGVEPSGPEIVPEAKAGALPEPRKYVITPETTREELDSWPIEVLRSQAQQRDLPTGGSRAEVIGRLLAPPKPAVQEPTPAPARVASEPLTREQEALLAMGEVGTREAAARMGVKSPQTVLNNANKAAKKVFGARAKATDVIVDEMRRRQEALSKRGGVGVPARPRAPGQVSEAERSGLEPPPPEPEKRGVPGAFKRQEAPAAALDRLTMEMSQPGVVPDLNKLVALQKLMKEANGLDLPVDVLKAHFEQVRKPSKEKFNAGEIAEAQSDGQRLGRSEGEVRRDVEEAARRGEAEALKQAAAEAQADARAAAEALKLPPKSARETEYAYQNRIRREAGAYTLADAIREYGGIKPESVENLKWWKEQLGGDMLFRDVSGKKGTRSLSDLHQELQDAHPQLRETKERHGPERMLELASRHYLLDEGRWADEQRMREEARQEIEEKPFGNPWAAGHQLTIDGRKVPIPPKNRAGVQGTLTEGLIERQREVEKNAAAFEEMKRAVDESMESDLAREHEGGDEGFDFGIGEITKLPPMGVRQTPPGLPEPPPSGESMVGGIPGNAGRGRPDGQQVFGMAREKVTEERADRGRDAIEKAMAKSDPKAWEEAKAAFAADPDVGRKLLERLEVDPAMDAKRDVPVLLLYRVALGNEAARTEQAYLNAKNMLHGPERTPLSKSELEPYKRAAENAVALRDRLDYLTDNVVGNQLGYGLRLFRLLAREDYTLERMLSAGRKAKGGKPLTAEEEATIKADQKEIEEAGKELQKVEDAGEEKTDKGRDARVRVRVAKRKWKQQTLVGLGDAGQTRGQRIRRLAVMTLNSTRPIITGFDLAPLLRQGLPTTVIRPSLSLNAFRESLKAGQSSEYAERHQQQILDRPNAPLYARDRLRLLDENRVTTGEEQVVRNLFEMFPKEFKGLESGLLRATVGNVLAGVRRMTEGSGRIYSSYLNQIRADTYDVLHDKLARNGTPTPVEGRAIADLTNVFTGAGDSKVLDKHGNWLAQVLFSPRYLVSRFQFLAGQPAYYGTARTRKLVAQEYVRTLIGAGLVLTLARAALPDSEVDLNPYSPDFGKIRVGRQVLDPLAGLSQTTRFTANTGLALAEGVKRLWDRGHGRKGEREAGDIYGRQLMRFGQQKLAPLPGAVASVMLGVDASGKPATPGGMVKNLTIPLSPSDIFEAFEKEGVGRNSALSFLALVGAGVQNYEKNAKATAGVR